MFSKIYVGTRKNGARDLADFDTHAGKGGQLTRDRLSLVY